MKALRIFLAGLCFLGGAGNFPAWAQVRIPGVESDPGSGVKIDVTQILGNTPDYGFVPVKIAIRNDSGKTRTWNFHFETGSESDYSLLLHSGGSIEVGSNKTREMTLLVPLPGGGHGDDQSKVGVRVSGYGLAGRRAGEVWGRGGYDSIDVGFSPSVYSNHERKVEEILKKEESFSKLNNVGGPSLVRARRGSPPGNRMHRDLSANKLDFSLLPPDWRSYSGMALLVFDEKEWNDLPEAQEQAVRDWMTLGGRVVVRKAEGPAQHERAGFGGLSELGVAEEDVPAAIVREILKAESEPALPWRDDFSQDWKMAEDLGGPLISGGLIIGFVVLFGIVVAPLNLFVFAPAGARHRLFWTVPLISVGASVLLAAVIVLQDGFGGSGARIAVVQLLAREHKLALVQEQISRTALLIGAEFSLPDHFLFAEIPARRARSGGGEAWREGGQAWGGWFASRSMKAQQIKALLPSRSRLSVVERDGNGAPVLLSTLPVELGPLLLIDKDGRRWTAGRVKTGEKTVLAAAFGNADAANKAVEEKASPNLQALYAAAAGRPGYFYALSGAGGGFPVETLGSIRWGDDTVVYLGEWLEGAE